jgi:hypothetical protein
MDRLAVSRVSHPEDAIFVAVTIPVGYGPGVSHSQGNPSGRQVPNKHGYKARGFGILVGNL